MVCASLATAAAGAAGVSVTHVRYVQGHKAIQQANGLLGAACHSPKLGKAVVTVITAHM
jgi:hypothetical protein